MDPPVCRWVAGLTDQWALSICLFAVKFGVDCLPTLFLNSRPTQLGKLERTPPSVYRQPHLYEVFADPDADGALYALL